MDDPWHLANDAYHTGARKLATKHIKKLLSSNAPPLEHTLHHINHHAILSHSTTPSPPPLPCTTSRNPAVVLLAEEAALTGAYNTTLRALRDSKPPGNAGIEPLEKAAGSVYSVVAYFADGNAERERKREGEGEGLVVKPTRRPLRIVLRAVRRVVADDVPAALRTPLRRWSDAAASVYELLAAGLLLRRAEKPILTNISTALRSLVTALSTPSTHDRHEAHDDHAARSAYLTLLSTSTQAFTPTYAESDEHLPTAYLQGVQKLLSHDPDAKRHLEHCAARSYRLADSLSLLARLETGEQALLAWQRAFAVDVRRPHALWLAAREFGRAGKYQQQARILGCLEELLGRDDGVVEYDGVKIEPAGLVVEEEEEEEKVVTRGKVAAERARALGAAGEWKEAAAVLGRLKEDAFGADVLRDRAQCAICEGRVSEGMSLAETAKAASAGPTDNAGALLIQAEGLLRTEEVATARQKLMEAFREARLGLVGVSEAEAPRLLRGVCFHNLAVLHYCIDENAAADECFAAAETAFRKCEDSCREIAERLGLLSAYGRCLVMWGRGMKEDAAEYWRTLRGLSVIEDVEMNGDDDQDMLDRPTSHVVCEVDDGVLQRFDRICLGICKEVEKRKEMEKLVEEVEKEWPLGQKRRKRS